MLQTLRQFFLSHRHHSFLIAYSGGLDSHVLLSLCHSLRDEFALNLRVVHIHHGLSPNADRWAQHCARVCEGMQLDLMTRKVQIDLNNGDGLEAAARHARYKIFAELMQENEVLLTAHQQDDQAETVLLQLLRGAGPKGLAAMPGVKLFAKGLHARPLLAFSRRELQTYAEMQKLQWIDDESNQNTKLTRNYLRHDIMPRLLAHWPSAVTTIARSAAHCAESQHLLNEFAQDACKDMEGSRANTLSVAKLLEQTQACQRLLLRTWMHQQGHPLPDTAKLTSILQDVLTAAWDRSPLVSWQETELRRYRDDLFLLPQLETHDIEQCYSWNLSEILTLPGIGKLQAQQIKGKGLRIDASKLEVRFRQGGEVVDLGARGNHTLKNLFQEWNVLPWERDRIPLFYIGETLVAILHYFTNKNYVANSDEMGWELNLR